MEPAVTSSFFFFLSTDFFRKWLQSESLNLGIQRWAARECLFDTESMDYKGLHKQH